MVSFADKFVVALKANVPSISLSEGVDVAFGSRSALLPPGTNTAFVGGILAFCLDEFVGGTCYGGLIQGKFNVLQMGMCTEIVLPGMRCCLKKSH
jgi:hypothetical protein